MLPNFFESNFFFTVKSNLNELLRSKVLGYCPSVQNGYNLQKLACNLEEPQEQENQVLALSCLYVNV